MQTKDNPADLINVALEELVRTRCELPGFTTLDAMASTIRAEVNTALFTKVAGRLGPADRSRLGRLLLVDPITRRSEFDRVKDTAKPPRSVNSRLALTTCDNLTIWGRQRYGSPMSRRARSHTSPVRRR